MPTVPIWGCEKTAVAMLVWSGAVGSPPNTVCAGAGRGRRVKRMAPGARRPRSSRRLPSSARPRPPARVSTPGGPPAAATTLVSAMASMSATGVSASRSVTSPIAHTLGAVVREYSSTCAGGRQQGWSGRRMASVAARPATPPPRCSVLQRGRGKAATPCLPGLRRWAPAPRPPPPDPGCARSGGALSTGGGRGVSGGRPTAWQRARVPARRLSGSMPARTRTGGRQHKVTLERGGVAALAREREGIGAVCGGQGQGRGQRQARQARGTGCLPPIEQCTACPWSPTASAHLRSSSAFAACGLGAA